MPPMQPPAQGYMPPPEPKKKRKISKQQWIIAIVLGVVAGALSFGWFLWQRSQRETPQITPPPIETPQVTLPPTEPPVTPTPTPQQPEDPAGDVLEGTTWELVEIIADGQTYGKDMLDSEGMYMTFQFKPNGAVTGDFVGEIGEGTYSVTFWNEVIIEIDNEQEILHLVGDTIRWDAGDTVMIFQQVGTYIQRPTQPDGGFIRKVTLGDFVIENNDAPDRQRGWCTNGADGHSTPWNARDFTSHRYLILELGADPKGDFQFVWYGDSNGWIWTQTDSFKAQGRTVVFDLSTVNGYEQFLQSSEIFILIGYYSDNWYDMPLVDAYFADAR